MTLGFLPYFFSSSASLASICLSSAAHLSLFCFCRSYYGASYCTANVVPENPTTSTSDKIHLPIKGSLNIAIAVFMLFLLILA